MPRRFIPKRAALDLRACRLLDRACGRPTAERIADPSVTGHMLFHKAIAHAICNEIEAALEKGNHALSLIPEQALERADLMAHLLVANYHIGRFAEVMSRSIPDPEAVARRVGRHDLLAWSRALQNACQLNLTGDMRAYLEQMEIPSRTEWLAVTRLRMAAARFHLGDTERALTQMASAAAEPGSLYTREFAKAMLFNGTVFAGRVEDARMLFEDVEPWLPAVDERHIYGAWAVLDTSVPGLMLAGEVVRCGALYPSCVTYLGTGVVSSYWSMLPGNPQTVAGIAAHAAGLRDRARDHFETAIRQADELPLRLLQPTARYWYGRLLVDDPHPAEQARGRAMIVNDALGCTRRHRAHRSRDRAVPGLPGSLS